MGSLETWYETVRLICLSRNNVVFTKAVFKLLSILSDWETRDVSHGQSITLALTAHSPSDTQHMFKEAHVQHNSFNILLAPVRLDDDDFHGFRGGVITRTSPRFPAFTSVDFYNVYRRLARPMAFDFFDVRQNCFPEVKMIKRLWLHYITFRELRASAFQKLLTESLTDLREIRHLSLQVPRHPEETHASHLSRLEPYIKHGTSTNMGDSYDGYQLPATIERLELFQCLWLVKKSSSGYELAPDDREPVPKPAMLTTKGPKPAMLPLKGTYGNLRDLSISFVSSAMDCFDSWIALKQEFPRLETIIMTTEGHLQAATPRSLNSLLKKAAIAAMKMPKLETMKL